MKDQVSIAEKLDHLYEKTFGTAPVNSRLLPASGSSRQYYRITNDKGESVIGVSNKNKAENSTFIYFTSTFKKMGMPVPEVLAIDSHKEIYLLKDLGTESLYDIIKKEGHSDRVWGLMKKVIDQLVKFHWQVGSKIDYTMCFAASKFDIKQIFSDLLYFKYYFVDPLEIDYNKGSVLEEMRNWASELDGLRPRTFMYRDFQSRNIIVSNEEVYFIDYQGGMSGLPAYDLASLLWQSRAKFPPKWKAELVNYYFEALSRLPEKAELKEIEFRKAYLQCVLLRMLQTLGAYGFRGIIQGKELFLTSIPPALKQLKTFLEEYPQVPAYNELQHLLKKITGKAVLGRFILPDFPKGAVEKLKVQVYSFSYKKGIPVDESGNGGGFVFDCRGIYNPGRLEDYRELTGKDQPVKDFLMEQTEMPRFLEGVFTTVDLSVKTYLQREFDHLSVSFGCTGGQHRSVFAAESLARHLREKFGLDVKLIHLEQEPHEISRR